MAAAIHSRPTGIIQSLSSISRRHCRISVSWRRHAPPLEAGLALEPKFTLTGFREVNTAIVRPIWLGANGLSMACARQACPNNDRSLRDLAADLVG